LALMVYVLTTNQWQMPEPSFFSAKTGGSSRYWFTKVVDTPRRCGNRPLRAHGGLEKPKETISTAAVICDCDGTLVDTDRPYLEALNAAIADVRATAGGDSGKEVSMEIWIRDLAGRGLEADAEYSVRNFNLDCSADEFLVRWKRYFIEISAIPGALPAKPGFDELYGYARGKNMKFAVASSSDGHGLRQKLLNGLIASSSLVSGLDDFDCVLSNDDVTKHKPDPEIYLLAAARLGVPPSECWVVEDTEPGVLAGQAAGMRVAAVPSCYTRQSHDFSAADAIINNLGELVTKL